MNTSTIVQKLWNYCNVLRDAGPEHRCSPALTLRWPGVEHRYRMTRRHPLRGRILTPWGPCSARRVASIFYGDYVEQLTYLLFLKMADERTRQPLLRCSTSRHPWRSLAPYNQKGPVPSMYSWPSLGNRSMRCSTFCIHAVVIKKDGNELFDHYRHTLEALGNQKGLLGLIFNKSQNKFDSAHPWSSACGRAARVQIRSRRNCQAIVDVMAPKPDVHGCTNAARGPLLRVLRLRHLSVHGHRTTPRAAGETVSDPACGTGGFLRAA